MPLGSIAAIPGHTPLILKVLLVVAALLAMAAPALAAEKVVSSRVWPAEEYTRVTLETARPVKHQYFFVTDPDPTDPARPAASPADRPDRRPAAP